MWILLHGLLLHSLLRCVGLTLKNRAGFKSEAQIRWSAYTSSSLTMPIAVCSESCVL